MSLPSLGTLELTVLLAIVRLDADAYGLAIRRDISSRVGHDYSVGAIYTTLERLEVKGFIISRLSEPTPNRGGRARKHFRITASGQRAVREAERVAASVWAGTSRILKPKLT